jgi:hypothetical protein
MTDQKIAKKISSFAAPTAEDVAYFESLPPDERLPLLKAELEKGAASGLSNRTFEEIVADARSKFEARRSSNG